MSHPQSPQTNSSPDSPPSKPLKPLKSPAGRVSTLSLALLSGAALLLEIALTRLFSTLFYPPYVFAIISLAILGIGLGAAFAAWQPRWRLPARLGLYLTLAGVSTLVLLLVVVWTAAIDLHGGLLALVVPPYFFVGLSLATFFSAAPADSPRLYRADLLGAGLGALLAIPLLDLLGGLNSVLAVAVLFGISAGLGGRSKNRRAIVWPLLLVVLATGGLLANLAPGLRWLAVDMAHLATAKPITGSLANGGQIIYTSWDAFARTDLVDPGGGRPYELYIDGAAGSVMPAAGTLDLLRSDIGFFPFATARPAQVLVIGPGGGLDVWFGLAAGAAAITAVEINPASVAIANRFAAYHGDLYGRPQVRVLVDEGRSVLRREAQRYDLIYLSQVVTLAAERSGYALTENSIYTVEAFADYFNHLQPDGQLALKLYDELTLIRAVVTAATALVQTRQISEAEALRHLAVFLDPTAEPPVPLLLAQNRAFTRNQGLALAGVAVQVGFRPLFVPQVTASPQLDAILAGEAGLAGLIANSASDVSPTTDDRPFFYQFEPGLPRSLQPLLWGLGTLVLAGAAGLGLVQRRYAGPLVRAAPLYFAALGVGFIAVEIALIQQTRLFLGHPTLAVTSVLAVLLLGGGLGSGWAGRWPRDRLRTRLALALLLIVGLVLLWLLLWPWLSRFFLASQIAVRLAVVAAGLLPLGLLLGIPFPLGLRLVGAEADGGRHVALGWAVNGVMTVSGSILAISLAMLAGFRGVLLAGAGAYLVALLVLVWTTRRQY